MPDKPETVPFTLDELCLIVSLANEYDKRMRMLLDRMTENTGTEYPDTPPMRNAQNIVEKLEPYIEREIDAIQKTYIVGDQSSDSVERED